MGKKETFNAHFCFIKCLMELFCEVECKTVVLSLPALWAEWVTWGWSMGQVLHRVSLPAWAHVQPRFGMQLPHYPAVGFPTGLETWQQGTSNYSSYHFPPNFRTCGKTHRPNVRASLSGSGWRLNIVGAEDDILFLKAGRSTSGFSDMNLNHF